MHPDHRGLTAGHLQLRRLAATPFAAFAILCIGFVSRAEALVYWTNHDAGTIGRANLDGSGVNQEFIVGASDPVGIAVDGSYLYWANSTMGTIGRANLDGSGVNQEFIVAGPGVSGVAVNGAHVYWEQTYCEEGSPCHGRIGRANLDGSGVDRGFIDTGPSVLGGIAVDGAHIYWSHVDLCVREPDNCPFDTLFSADGIARANLDGSDLQPLFLNGVEAIGVAVDEAHIYWIRSELEGCIECATSDSIGRANIDGSGVSFFIDLGSENGAGVAVDASHVYWTSADIGRSNVDGTAAEQSFITGASNPQGVVVDSAPYASPRPSIDFGPSGAINDSTPTFMFSADRQDSSFECQIDLGGYSPCSSPYETGLLGDGQHTFEVRATDEAGGTDPWPATRTFTVDTVAPTTAIESGPAQGATTNHNAPTFSFSSNEAASTFECNLDGTGFAPCSSPFTSSPLADGTHSFEVRATDAAGNLDPNRASRIFTVDTVPPKTSMDSGPPGLTNNATPTFSFSSEAGASFECRLSGGDYAPCSSPFTAAPLTDGAHSFEVRATDAAANTDPSPPSRAFTVDTIAPNTWIDSGPVGATDETTPSFTFSSEAGASFECQLDGGSFRPCSSPFATSRLNNSPHIFEVRATDAAANADPSPAIRRFTVVPRPTLPPPERGETVNVDPVSGVVRVRAPGSESFRVLAAPEQLPVETLIDTARGRVALTSAARADRTQTAKFYGGDFRVEQRRSGKPTTELMLVNIPGKGRRHRHRGSGDGLWGNGHGHYVTKGKYGSATVRGTIWFTQEVSQGTYFRVKKDTVLVRDFTRHRTILLHPGQDYLAPAP